MKSVNEKSLIQNPQKNYKQNDYSVHYESDLTKIKIKKVYNIEDIGCSKSDDGFMPQILEHSEVETDHVDSNLESIKSGSDANSDNKRRRSGNLNSSNEENSPRVCHDKKRSKIEQRQKMFEEYYPWVFQTYGDAAKTKTITIKKLNRIINALNGKESNRPDSSKFRFWVKTKGFTTTRPENFVSTTFDEGKDNLSKAEVTPLYVLQVADSGTQTYKQVAVVEHFFDIIYHIHVALGSKRCGRHAGQKRTYRTITETYAFLPREAVSKFLSLCTQCKKQQITESTGQKKHVTMPNASNYYDNRYLTSNLSDATLIKHERNIGLDYKRTLFKPYENNNNKYGDTSKNTPANLNINETLNYYQLLTLFYHNFNLTSSASTSHKQEYIKNFPNKLPKISNQMNNSEAEKDSDTNNSNELKIPNPWTYSPKERKLSQLVTSTPETNNRKFSVNNENKSKEDGSESIKQMTSTYLSMTRSLGLEDDDALNLESIATNASPPATTEQPEPNSTDPYGNMLKDTEKLKLMLLAWNYQNSAAVQNGTDGPDFATMSALWSQYQNALAVTGEKSKINQNEQFSAGEDLRKADTPDENNSSGQKEDDDSEDESEDKLEQSSPKDPERLKAFNMFVRLFVDENLDRMVPISKQPKEKVQAIIDSCTRQFPEFSERARKRIRTYLKSCRRNKRTRDGWENTTRPTPAHLTSVQAEQILAIACENESLNVKRMRVGLEPIGHGTDPNVVSLVAGHSQIEPDTVTIPTPANIARISPISNGSTNQNNVVQNLSTHSMKHQQPSSSSTTAQLPRITTTTLESTSPVNYAIKTEVQRETVKENAPATPKNYHNIFANPTNTPTDLSLKRPVFPHKLSQSEILAVKQLITGYRESAAFLLRSADELDQLLQQQ